MARFCARLRAAGFRTATFSYPSMRRGAEDNAESLARFISKVKAVRIHVVAHSLGGLIALLYAHGRPDARLSRLVLLGSPVSGSAVAARLASSRLGRLFLGQARAALTAGVRPPLPAYLAIGVIAGTLGFGLGRLVMPLRGQHDGTVQVEETRLPEATDMITLPVTHTGMMFSARVADAVCAFLAGGRFPREQQ